MTDAVQRYVETLLSASTPENPAWNKEHILAGAKPKWNYIDGCMMRALMRLGEVWHDSRYTDFCKHFMDHYVKPDGALLGYAEADYNLDNICEGNALIDLYELTGDERYMRGMRRLLSQLDFQPRTDQGSYWHKLIYPNQVWLDGLYMAQVFRVRFAARYGGNGVYEDVLMQFKLVREHMFDAAKRLYRHGYDASKKAFWADKNGLSANVWLRSMGWYVAALADVLKEWPPETDGSDWLRACLDEALAGLFGYIDERSGMLMQVVDAGRREGNYPETSGSALVAYACLRVGGVWRERGCKLLDSVERNALGQCGDTIELTGICLVAGLGPQNNRRRDGSYEYYISEPVVTNEAKGVAPFLMAYAEREAMEQDGKTGAGRMV